MWRRQRDGRQGGETERRVQAQLGFAVYGVERTWKEMEDKAALIPSRTQHGSKIQADGI